MLAAEATFEHLQAGSEGGDEITEYPVALRASSVWEDLRKVRNVKPSLKYGLWIGTFVSGIYMWLEDLGLGFLVPWTLHHYKADHERLKLALSVEDCLSQAGWRSRLRQALLSVHLQYPP
jgi:electron-transferring-flavoprotein dehydrogenase